MATPMLRTEVESVRSRCQREIGSVFEIDRIDLVRHGGRSDFVRDGALLEVAERNIAPEIAAQIDEDRVEAAGDGEVLRHEVVRFDLRGAGIPGQAQALDENTGQPRPVHLGIGGKVGVEIANGAVHLAEQGQRGKLFALAPQAVHEYGDFLAQGGG